MTLSLAEQAVLGYSIFAGSVFLTLYCWTKWVRKERGY
jgi:hypothetical protein